jgi:polar amino acid transport system substrate-binding protein
VIRHLEARKEPLALSYRVNAGRVPPEHWTRDPDVGGGRLVGEGCHFVELCSAIVDAPLDGIAAVPMAGDGFMLTLRYMDGSVGVVAYAVGGSGSMRKERLEVLGGGRSAAIDDFRGVELHPSKARVPNPLARSRNKGHRAIIEAAVRFFREGGEPPIPYARLLETTRATLVARRSCASGTTALVSLAE